MGFPRLRRHNWDPSPDQIAMRYSSMPALRRVPIASQLRRAARAQMWLTPVEQESELVGGWGRMGRCGLNGSDAQHCEDRSGVRSVKRCAAFFVSRCHRTLKPGSALQCGRPVRRCFSWRQRKTYKEILMIRRAGKGKNIKVAVIGTNQPEYFGFQCP